MSSGERDVTYFYEEKMLHALLQSKSGLWVLIFVELVKLSNKSLKLIMR